MNIRPADIRDAEAMSALMYPLTEKSIANGLSLHARNALLASMSVEAIQENIRVGYRYHVAEIGGQVIGVVGVRDNSHLYHLFVAEPHERKGVARVLWMTALRACRLAGNQCEITVNSSQNAQGFYEKLGFVAQAGPVVRNGIVSVPMKLAVDVREE